MSENSEKTRKTRTQYGFTRAQFVEAWESSNSPKEVAKKLSQVVSKEVPVAIVAARKASYKKAGTNLKDMPRRGGGKLDVDAMNAQIAELRKQG
jgi:hypothetical protein